MELKSSGRDHSEDIQSHQAIDKVTVSVHFPAIFLLSSTKQQ